MELNYRKESRCNRIMRSKSFDTQEMRKRERERPEGSRRSERHSHFMDGNDKKCLPDGRKESKNQEKFKKCGTKFMPERGWMG